MKPPEIIDSREILIKTYWDVMDCKDRETVFNAYDYNQREKKYYLKRPELLTEGIIKKLS